MRLHHSFFYTLRENVKDEDSLSGNLLVRAGMIKKSSSGVYMYLPLGYRVLKKIEQIVREEMNATQAQEVLMPALIPEEAFIASGRRANFGKSMFSLKDRYDKPYVLGPTHEELFAIAAGMKIRSYKDLPFNIYQFQTKYRDEARPRFGLIRVREFIMKDAYSFDTDLAGLDISYTKMFEAYKKSFDRMDLEYKIVRADTGVMGGLLSEEFQAVTDIGEDVLVLCDQCDFSSNLEVATCVDHGQASTQQHEIMECVETPHARTIEEVTAFLNKPSECFVKTLIYSIDEKAVAVLVRGDREVNETKVLKLFNGIEIELASMEIVETVTHAKVGFAGPIGLEIPVIMDLEVSHMANFVVGANKTGFHYINVNVENFTPTQICDVRQIQQGDVCPVCGGKIVFKKGIEIGNTFKLGTKYSQALHLEYSDSDNSLQPVYMGSYGIGIGRCMAALAEQKGDENGIQWPINIAPYHVAIVLISLKDDLQIKIANQLHDQLEKLGIDVILDDRDERPGVKFKDVDLIGIPLRITVGKKVTDNLVEFKVRGDESSQDIHVDQIVEMIQAKIHA